MGEFDGQLHDNDPSYDIERCARVDSKYRPPIPTAEILGVIGMPTITDEMRELLEHSAVAVLTAERTAGTIHQAVV